MHYLRKVNMDLLRQEEEGNRQWAIEKNRIQKSGDSRQWKCGMANAEWGKEGLAGNG